MLKALFALWGLSHIVSFGSLLFYRARTGHGPDTVGDEVSHFAIPLLVALACSIGSFFLAPRPPTCVVDLIARWSPLITMAMALLEVGIYSWFIVR